MFSLFGAQLSAKAHSVQTLWVSQGALLGFLLGLFLVFSIPSFGKEGLESIALIFSVIFAMALNTFLNLLARRQLASKNTRFLAAFAVLMACSSFLIRFYPSLESYFNRLYFGDLFTMTD